MAASLIVEEESGTCTAHIRHPHNGYYAGDFSQARRAGTPGAHLVVRALVPPTRTFLAR